MSDEIGHNLLAAFAADIRAVTGARRPSYPDQRETAAERSRPRRAIASILSHARPYI